MIASFQFLLFILTFHLKQSYFLATFLFYCSGGRLLAKSLQSYFLFLTLERQQIVMKEVNEKNKTSNSNFCSKLETRAN